MSLSQRRGVLTLIPKEDSDLSTLANWRPIILLNLDYKIASKAIAKRIKKLLALLINPDLHILDKVVSAVPRHLVERARANHVHRVGSLSSSMFHLSPETSMNLNEKKKTTTGSS